MPLGWEAGRAAPGARWPPWHFAVLGPSHHGMGVGSPTHLSRQAWSGASGALGGAAALSSVSAEVTESNFSDSQGKLLSKLQSPA